MKHISFVIGGMTRGGAERVISILANYYASKGWKVDIVMMLDYVVMYDLNPSINLVDMTIDKGNRLRNAPKWVNNFRHYVKVNHPDLIVSFVARINIVVLLATLGIPIPIIISERNDPAADGRSKAIDFFTKKLYPRAQKIVFQTERAKKYFDVAIQNKGIIILNPILIEADIKLKPKKRIISVGRLAPQKNHHLLIRAFAEISKQHPEYELCIYGNGLEMKMKLEKLIEELGLSESVMLPGNISDIHRKMSEAEIFVLSSNYEGLSNALLEAMMLGLPCISTDCAGSDEIIIDNVNGLLVPVGDQKKLSEAMLYMIENPKKRLTFAEKGKETVEKCRAEFVLKQWNKIIEEQI